MEFEIDDPRQGDWVGIYDASVPLDNLHVAHFWLWVCDNQGNGIGCNGRVSYHGYHECALLNLAQLTLTIAFLCINVVVWYHRIPRR